MIRVEMTGKRGECILHVDNQGAVVLRQAAGDVCRNGPAKVFIGELGAMLILRHVDYSGGEEQR